jgi:dephospho-CoA kinase
LNADKHIVGLTGGIGSGKTTVAKIFEAYDIPVFYADDAAKFLMNNDVSLIQKIKKLFGDNAYSGKHLNRKYIANQVFENNEKLQQLNALVHPAVGNYFREWLNKQPGKIIIKEAAILIESGSYKDCHEIIVVTAPEKLRIQRLLKRDSSTEQEIKSRMQHQLSNEERLKYANHQIINDENHSLLLQCDTIVKHWNKMQY